MRYRRGVEPALTCLVGILNATFCIWRQHHDTLLQTGAVNYIGLGDRVGPDGAWDLLGVLTDPPAVVSDVGRKLLRCRP